MKLALDVFLGEVYVGSTELNTHKTIHVNDRNKYRSNTVEEGITEAIASVCWAREDDLCELHMFDEFHVKGSVI